MPFRKSDPRPQISAISPVAAIPGGEFQIRGKGFGGALRPTVRFGGAIGSLVVGSDSMLIVRVPEGANSDEVEIAPEDQQPATGTCAVGMQIAEGLHPVANPAVDRTGVVYSTFSGSRGQRTPASVYRVDPGGSSAVPFVSDLMNATSLAFDQDDQLYVSSRHEGIIYRVAPNGSFSVYVEGMGVATGIAFDQEDNLYVGDRSGTIFKVSRQRQIYVFATLESSISAYHLAFGPEGYLYVTGPTTSSYDSVHRVSPDGHVDTFYRGLGRPQGMAFDAKGNLYVAASFGGRRGVVKLNPSAEPELFLSGPSVVGLAFTPAKEMILATSNALFRANVNVEGRRLP
jgi:sugar lactone lactonase YvrE